MTRDEVMLELEALGTAQTVKTYARHGVKGPAFGVSYANLGKLRKRIKQDHALARDLWATRNHDARILATMIADPAKVSVKELEAWRRDVDNGVQSDALGSFVGRTPHAQNLAAKWTSSRGEWVSSAGWLVVGCLAPAESEVPDSVLMGYIDTLGKDIHRAENRTRYAMNSALIAIGGYRPSLRARALAVARAIGKVEVDHGDTECKTPDATAYIQKMAARAEGGKATNKAGTKGRSKVPAKKVPAKKAQTRRAVR
jgi:3-methyladenine DNA glycosylase AlkD